MLRHALLGIVDGLGGGFLTQGLDVAGFVTDIGYVHVNEAKANLAKFRFYVGGHVGEEFIAVCVDFLDVHGGNHQTELTEEDIRCDVLDAVYAQAQQALGGVGHAFRFGGDTHGKAAGNVYADVLLGQGVGEVALNGDGLEVQVGVVLENRPDEGGAAMDTLGRGHAAGFTVDNQDFVRGAATIALEDGREGYEQHGRQNENQG